MNNTIIIISLIFTIFSCKIDNYLNSSPKTSLTEKGFYTTRAQLESAFNDIYRQMGRLYDAYSIPSLYGELFADNAAVIGQLGGSAVEAPIDRHLINTNNSRIGNAWDVSYNAIYIINNVIFQIQTTDLKIDQVILDRWVSESLVIRSLAYFNLVRAFGPVPYVKKKISPIESYNYLRESPDVVLNGLIEDLKFAKENLPKSYGSENIGRITRYGAAALLAKIYMTTGESEHAATELLEIINSGQFTLDSNGDGTININDYAYLFQPNTKNCASSILEVQYHSGINAPNSNHQEAFSPHLDNFDHPYINEDIRRGGGINIPTEDLIKEFEENDSRKELTFLEVYKDESNGSFVEYPFTIKFFDPNWYNPGQNFEIIRYADVLLMYAEVMKDYTYLNQVRNRVGLPSYGSEDYPTDQYPTLDLAIEHERRVELSLEMHRMFDLVRTGRAMEVLSKKIDNFNEDRLVFPIPQRTIDTNPAIEQNYGY